MNNLLDQADRTLIDALAKLYFEAGMTYIPYGIVGGKDVSKNINEALEKHIYRQAIPLLGDEQKEL